VRGAFRDRTQAGEQLADRLRHLAGRPVRVLALPRGGVVVAAPIAERLHAPLDVLIVRKIGTPWHRELAMGALAIWGAHEAVVRNDHVIDGAGVPEADFAEGRQRELAEARRRLDIWPATDADLAGRDVVVVDDGLATGATMRAAVEVLNRAGAGRVIVAVPVGAPDELRELAEQVDEVVCLAAPRPFHAVGAHYQDFGQVDDETVSRVLERARSAGVTDGAQPGTSRGDA
jgi:putative phosphoribosyl transferase